MTVGFLDTDGPFSCVDKLGLIPMAAVAGELAN